MPPDDYFNRVKVTLDEEGILFIADEVQSGFGRTGKMFAIEHYGVVPDIMTMAKGIADGWPLSAFTARAEIADAFQSATTSAPSAATPSPAPRRSPTSTSSPAAWSTARRAGRRPHGQVPRAAEDAAADRRGARHGPHGRHRADRRPRHQGLRHRRRRLRAPIPPRPRRAHRRGRTTSAPCCASSRRWSSTRPSSTRSSPPWPTVWRRSQRSDRLKAGPRGPAPRRPSGGRRRTSCAEGAGGRKGPPAPRALAGPPGGR